MSVEEFRTELALEHLREQVARLTRERDEARAEVDRLARKVTVACCPGRRTGQHSMYCRHYVGPLEHRWASHRVNPTFGGMDFYCLCGGWFRQGGLAGHGDGTETATPICPNAHQRHRPTPPKETPK